MQLKNLFIKEYKMLKDFHIEFSQPLTLLIGKNGAGKTTLLESLVWIFSPFYDCENITALSKINFPFSFKISYELRKEKRFESSTSSESFVNYIVIESEYDQDTKAFNLTLLEAETRYDSFEKIEKHLYSIGESVKYLFPENLVIYYSGISDTLGHRYERRQERLITDLIKNGKVLEQDFYYFQSQNFRSLLATLLCYHYGEIPQLLRDKFQITGFEWIDIIIHRPAWAKGLAKEFWGAKGDLLKFLEILLSTQILISSDEKMFQFRIKDIDELEKIWSRLGTEKDLFKYLIALKQDGLLWDTFLRIHKNGVIISDAELSEGEKQLLIILGLKSILVTENTLFIFDEPDTYLHPSWQNDYIKNIQDNTENKCHYIITSHNPSLLNNLNPQNGELQIIKEGKLLEHSLKWYGRDVNEVVHQIMDGEYRPNWALKEISEIDMLIENETTHKQAKEKLDILIQKLSDSDSEIVRLQTKLDFFTD